MNSVSLMSKCDKSWYALPSNFHELTEDLNSVERDALIVLISHMNKDDYTCFPSYNTIAQRIKKSRSTAIRVIQELVRKNYIYLKHRFNKKFKNAFHKSNLYTINKVKVFVGKVKEIGKKKKKEKKKIDIANEINSLIDKSALNSERKNNLRERFAKYNQENKINNHINYVKKMIEKELEDAKNEKKQNMYSNTSKKYYRGNYRNNNEEKFKTRFHNFEQASSKYTDEQLFTILMGDKLKRK